MKTIVGLLTPKNGTHFLIEGTTLRNALEKFRLYKFSALPIIDENGKYLRTISEGDLLRYITNLPNFNMTLSESIPISAVESYRPYQSIDIEATLVKVVALALEQNFIPLVDDRGLFIGIIKRKEILEYLMENRIDVETKE